MSSWRLLSRHRGHGERSRMQRVPTRPASVEESRMRPALRCSDKSSQCRVHSLSTTQDPGGPSGKEGGSSHSRDSDRWGIEPYVARPGMTGKGGDGAVPSPARRPQHTQEPQGESSVEMGSEQTRGVSGQTGGTCIHLCIKWEEAKNPSCMAPFLQMRLWPTSSDVTQGQNSLARPSVF